MKAVILTAGVGSRIRPLTDDKPKPLITLGSTSILELMINTVIANGITEIVVIMGYRADRIKNFLRSHYPDRQFTLVVNENYDKTNTGYSVLLAEPYVRGEDFIKFDGDVVFEPEVLKKLITSEHQTALCIDTNINLEAEEVKVILDGDQKVLEVGKKLNPHKADGESIGIEKIGKEAGQVFFAELNKLMKDKNNWQEYYDDTYTTLVAKGISMHAVDITGLKWVEIDTLQDYKKAQKLFT